MKASVSPFSIHSHSVDAIRFDSSLMHSICVSLSASVGVHNYNYAYALCARQTSADAAAAARYVECGFCIKNEASKSVPAEVRHRRIPRNKAQNVPLILDKQGFRFAFARHLNEALEA